MKLYSFSNVNESYLVLRGSECVMTRLDESLEFWTSPNRIYNNLNKVRPTFNFSFISENVFNEFQYSLNESQPSLSSRCCRGEFEEVYQV